MQNWVISALKHSGLSQAELARELTANYKWADNRSILNKIITGDRGLAANEMIDISMATGYPVPGLGVEEEQPKIRKVIVAAYIQAGNWADTWEWDEQDQYPVFIPDDPMYRHFKLYGAEARGPSMNKRYPEGTVLVFAAVEETKEEPIAGKRYVVERRRPTGEREHTVKLLYVDDQGKHWLMPESTDPRFQSAISVEEGTGDEDVVAIIGRVCYAVSRE